MGWGSHKLAVAAILLGVAAQGYATDVQLGGVIGERAVLIVNGGRPQTIAVGASTREGVKLLSVAGDEAAIETEGRRSRLRLGEQPISIGVSESGRGEVRLAADTRGHFITMGLINGVGQRFLVDTGATLVSIGADDAKRAGINYLAGTPATTMTANGPAQVWKVRLDTVQVGDVVLHGVEAAVHQHAMPIGLLGMSFLNRTELRREAGALILRKNY